MHEHRPTYEVKIFLHVNLSYEPVKHVKRQSCLPFRRPNISMIRFISLFTTELAYSLSLLISAMLLTPCCPVVLQRLVRNSLNDRSTEHDMILESCAKIDSN